MRMSQSVSMNSQYLLSWYRSSHRRSPGPRWSADPASTQMAPSRPPSPAGDTQSKLRQACRVPTKQTSEKADRARLWTCCTGRSRPRSAGERAKPPEGRIAASPRTAAPYAKDARSGTRTSVTRPGG